MSTDKENARRRRWAASSVVVLACIGAACSSSGGASDPHGEEEGPLGSAVSALDNVCTADPTKGLPTTVGYAQRFASSFQSPVDGYNNQNGFDVGNLTSVGPTCGFGVDRDDDCCEPLPGTPPSPAYTACKEQQEQNAIQFIQAFTPRAPLIPPVDADQIVAQGFYYNNHNPHLAIDMAKPSVPAGQDPGFNVYAAGDGEVVYATWHGLTAGNSIVLRHLLWDGSWYLTEYRHVRGGASHDKQMFCPCINPAGVDAAARLASCSVAQKGTKECKYAANPSFDAFWGTDADALPAIGTRFRVGDVIATAGNSGTVYEAINNAGELAAGDTSGNTHLHFSLIVPTGSNEGSPGAPDVMQIDPLGVYSKESGTKNGDGCYDPDATTTFPKLLQAFNRDEYVALRNHPGLSCRPTGSGALVYSWRGAAVNETAQSGEVVCPAGRFSSNNDMSNYLFARVWVDDQSSTDNVCCHVATKNPGGAERAAPEVCSSGTGAHTLVLDYPKVYDPFTWSHYEVSCTLPASSSGASSSIHTYRFYQQRI